MPSHALLPATLAAATIPRYAIGCRRDYDYLIRAAAAAAARDDIFAISPAELTSLRADADAADYAAASR